MVKNWKSTHINFGTVRPHRKVSVVIQCLDSLEDVVEIKHFCGCSPGHVSGNNVIVSFTGNIPKHLAMAGIQQFNVSKNLKVIYKSGKYDLLQLNGTVRR